MDIMGEAEYTTFASSNRRHGERYGRDVTRVGSIQCSSAVNALRFTFMDLNDRWA